MLKTAPPFAETFIYPKNRGNFISTHGHTVVIPTHDSDAEEKHCKEGQARQEPFCSQRNPRNSRQHLGFIVDTKPEKF